MIEQQQTDITKFFKALAIVATGIILGDFVIGSLLKYLYDRQTAGLLYRTTYSIDSTRAEYLVLGSSRANHDYDPAVFEANLQSTFYNCGRDKQGLLYSCAVLSAILERYQPKCVILDIRPDEFTQSDEGTLATLLPYYKNPAVRPYLDYNSKTEGLKLFSKIYPYNSLLSNLVVGMRKNWTEDYKGYRKLTNFNTDNRLDTLRDGPFVEAQKTKEFDRLAERLDKLHIRTFIVISPIHYHYIGSATKEICSSVAAKHPNITYLDFTNRAIDENNHLFSDNNHLNNIGAALFSKTLALCIKEQPIKHPKTME